MNIFIPLLSASPFGANLTHGYKVYFTYNGSKLLGKNLTDKKLLVFNAVAHKEPAI